MIDRKDFLDQTVKRDMRTYDNVQKIATGQGDDSTTGCILDYNYFNNYFTWYQLIKVTTSTWCWYKSNTII